jgi:hypothetical protein
VVRAHPTVPEQKISKHSHEVADKAALFVRPRYKRRYKWRVRMTALTRNKSGDYVARKVIPKDVRQAFAKLYGAGWEARLTNGKLSRARGLNVSHKRNTSGAKRTALRTL